MLTPGAKPESNDENDCTNDAFKALQSNEIKSRKRPLEKQSTFDIIQNGQTKHNRLNGTTPQKLTTKNDILKLVKL